LLSVRLRQLKPYKNLGSGRILALMRDKCEMSPGGTVTARNLCNLTCLAVDVPHPRDMSVGGDNLAA
jgi:hypothetical protein